MDFTLESIALFVLATSSVVNLQVVTPPENTAANPGSEVELKCYAPASLTHFWYQLPDSDGNNILLIIDGLVQGSTPPGLEISSNDNYSLILSNTSLDNTNLYSCYTISGSMAAALLIIEPTKCTYNVSDFKANGGLAINMSTSIPEVSEYQINIYCEAVFGGNGNSYSWVPPVIQCYVGDDRLVMVNSTEPGKILSMAAIQGKPELDNIPIVCVTFFNTPPIADDVEYAANVPSYRHSWTKSFKKPHNITISGIQNTYEEGDNLTCFASGDPMPTIRWEIETQENGRIFSAGAVFTVTNNMTGCSMGTCIAVNALSTKQLQIVINVTDNSQRVDCSVHTTFLSTVIGIDISPEQSTSKGSIGTSHEPTSSGYFGHQITSERFSGSSSVGADELRTDKGTTVSKAIMSTEEDTRTTKGGLPEATTVENGTVNMEVFITGSSRKTTSSGSLGHQVTSDRFPGSSSVIGIIMNTDEGAIVSEGMISTQEGSGSTQVGLPEVDTVENGSGNMEDVTTENSHESGDDSVSADIVSTDKSIIVNGGTSTEVGTRSTQAGLSKPTTFKNGAGNMDVFTTGHIVSIAVGTIFGGKLASHSVV